MNLNSSTWSYSVALPKPLKANANITLELNTVQSNAAFPYPAASRQEDPQSLKYTTDLFVISPYATVIQRSKIRFVKLPPGIITDSHVLRAPTPQVHNYTIPPAFPDFTQEERSASKSSATITYGPYNNIPISTTSEFLSKTQQRLSINYEIESPVLRVLSLSRSAEVSHWGSNLNIQDAIQLKNDGALLKGHFSRITHQIQTFQQRPTFGSLRTITLHLPPGISSPYFYDMVGNVSTSKFRPSGSPKTASLKARPPAERWSILELRPRYPVLGGWNYTFTLGWDAPLRDSARYDSKTGRYVLGVPVS